VKELALQRDLGEFVRLLAAGMTAEDQAVGHGFEIT
jgi:hypothetical protein